MHGKGLLPLFGSTRICHPLSVAGDSLDSSAHISPRCPPSKSQTFCSPVCLRSGSRCGHSKSTLRCSDWQQRS